MRILHRNENHTEVLANDVLVADAIHRRALGLMFRPPLDEGEAMVFRFAESKTRGIHTLFVRAPIDVVWVRNERATMVETVSPWTLRRRGVGDTIIELPEHGAQPVDVGDEIRLAR